MFCAQCGTKLEDDDRFCLKCGTPVTQGNEPINQSAQPSQETTVLPSAASSVPASSSSRRTKIAIIVLSCAIVVVAIIGIAIFLLTNSPNEESSSTTSTVAPTSSTNNTATVPVPDVEERSQADAEDAEHEYTVVAGKMTWDEAQAQCESMGGTLACITSQEEYEKVLSAAQASGYKVFWIGGELVGDSFQWVSGEPITYSAWASGEPNNDEDIETRMALFNVEGSWAWYDVPNDLGSTYPAEKMAFIMEREAE